MVAAHGAWALHSSVMAHRDWNESYAADELPWDTGEPEPLLVEFGSSGRVRPGPALEIGAGTGTNSIWLAERGFDVLGIDLAPLAVARANAKLNGRALPCRFAPWTFWPPLPRVHSVSSLTAAAFTSSVSPRSARVSPRRLQRSWPPEVYG